MSERTRRWGIRFGEGTAFGFYAGAILVLLGLLLLAENLGVYLPHWLGAGLFWPLLLIVAGIALIRRRARTA